MLAAFLQGPEHGGEASDTWVPFLALPFTAV